MEEKKIIAVYRQIIYADGTLDTTRMPIEYIFDRVDMGNVSFETNDNSLIPNPKLSERIKQIMAVLDEISKYNINSAFAKLSPFEFKKLVSKCIKTISHNFKVSEPTVVDKISRQLSITKSDFVMLVYNFYKEDNKDYKQTDLYVTISKKFTATDDEEYANNIFDTLK